MCCVFMHNINNGAGFNSPQFAYVSIYPLLEIVYPTRSQPYIHQSHTLYISFNFVFLIFAHKNIVSLWIIVILFFSKISVFRTPPSRMKGGGQIPTPLWNLHHHGVRSRASQFRQKAYANYTFNLIIIQKLQWIETACHAPAIGW